MRTIIKDLSDEQKIRQAINMLRTAPETGDRCFAADQLGHLSKNLRKSLKEKVIESLIEALDKGNMWVAKSAAASLGTFGPAATKAIPVLVRTLRLADSDVAWNSAQALGAMGPAASEAVPALLEVIKENQSKHLFNNRHNICVYATQALGAIGSRAAQAIPNLLSLLSHENPYLRIHAAIAIMRIDPTNQRARDSLENFLKERDIEVRRQTIWALEDMGQAATIAKDLIKVATANEDEAVRSAASRILENLSQN